MLFRSLAMLIIGTFVSIGGGLTIYILLMVKFAYISPGARDWIVTIAPIIIAVIYFLLTILRVAQGTSIFTSALFFFFQAFITASAIYADPDKANKEVLISEICIGLGFLFFVLFYVGMKTEKVKEEMVEQEATTEAASLPEKATKVVAEKVESTDKLTSDEAAEEVPEVSEKAVSFHLLMAFASLYYSMVLSNWGSPMIDGQIDPNGFSSKWLGTSNPAFFC